MRKSQMQEREVEVVEKQVHDLGPGNLHSQDQAVSACLACYFDPKASSHPGMRHLENPLLVPPALGS